jgi:hypothetical protein
MCLILLQYLQGVERRAKEIVAQSDLSHGITSGGGFSNYYTRPSFQDGAVTNYLNGLNGAASVPVSGYNNKGRGVPDISAQGTWFKVMVLKASSTPELTGLAGTSASCPVVAGIFSTLNAHAWRRARAPSGGSTPFSTNTVLLSSMMSSQETTSAPVTVLPAPKVTTQSLDGTLSQALELQITPNWKPFSSRMTAMFNRLRQHQQKHLQRSQLKRSLFSSSL